MSDGFAMGAEGGDDDAEGEDEGHGIEFEEEIAPKAAGKRKRIVDPDELDVKDNKLFAKRVVVDEKKPTAPRAGKSAPAEPTVRKKARTGIDRFAEIAAREEETTQKALELKKTKFQGETEKALARVRAQAEIQMNKDKLRMEFAQKKLELEYKFKLQLQAAQRSQMGGQGHSSANIYPTAAAQTAFQQPDFSPFSAHQDASSGFSFSDYNSYSSQASSGSRWQPNVASSSSNQGSSLSSSSFPLQVASQQSTGSGTGSPYSGWELTPTDDTSKSEGLTFTEQLNSKDDDDLY